MGVWLAPCYPKCTYAPYKQKESQVHICSTQKKGKESQVHMNIHSTQTASPECQCSATLNMHNVPFAHLRHPSSNHTHTGKHNPNVHDRCIPRLRNHCIDLELLLFRLCPILHHVCCLCCAQLLHASTPHWIPIPLSVGLSGMQRCPQPALLPRSSWKL